MGHRVREKSGNRRRHLGASDASHLNFNSLIHPLVVNDQDACPATNRSISSSDQAFETLLPPSRGSTRGSGYSVRAESGGRVIGLSPSLSPATSDSNLHPTRKPSNTTSCSSDSSSSSSASASSSRSSSRMYPHRSNPPFRDKDRPPLISLRTASQQALLQVLDSIIPPWKEWDSVAINLLNLPPEANAYVLWQAFQKEGPIFSIDLFEDDHGRRENKGKIRFKFALTPCSYSFGSRYHHRLTV